MAQEIEQMDKCLVCEKEYTKVKSWQKYCSKECKIYKYRWKDWNKGRFVYGFADTTILIDRTACTRAHSISYAPLDKIVLVIDYLDFLELEKKANLGKQEMRRTVYDDKISEVDFIVHNSQLASVVHTHLTIDGVKSRVFSSRGSGVLVELIGDVCSAETRVIAVDQNKIANLLGILDPE